ncbi:hypothetical protein [Variovorax boronicumulans]|uniref:hypothetical protein n=1 Tax=Variovorax boronicumulans TaxID=436515 RepID=UPI003398FBFA
MQPHYWTPDITVRIPFGSTELRRTAMLLAAGVPLDSSGEPARGFLHERKPVRIGGDSIFRWFDTGSAGLAPSTAAPERISAAQGAC